MNAEPGGELCQDCQGPQCAVCYYIHNHTIILLQTASTVLTSLFAFFCLAVW